TPPLLPIPLSTPSTSRRAGIPEADTPPWNRLLLATPRPGCEVEESSAIATRPSGPNMAHGVDCSYVETRLRDTERKMMTALELLNLRDRAAVRAKIEVLRSERLAYEQKGIRNREALARSEAYYRALEVRVAVLETHARLLEWQRQVADDFAVQHIMRTQALEAGARDDTLEDTGDHCAKWIIQIMAKTKRGQTPPPTNPNNPNNMTPEAVQTMIDQALLRNSGGGDGSHSSHAENPRNMHTARPFYYADFMKCHPLNFKGTEGAVGLTRWIDKMESVFNISGCDVENQVKFATCTLLDATLTWWNSQIRTLVPDAYTMTWSVFKKKMTDKYCPLGEFVSNETEKVDKYISGLPDNIYGNVKSSKPKTLDETIELANNLMD
nr:hypothetical protein [Tanacetum cinerariifolium]